MNPGKLLAIIKHGLEKDEIGDAGQVSKEDMLANAL